MDLNFSIGRILLLIYIIISSSYCSNLFSNGFKKAIETNVFVQHLILIILIMSLMIIIDNPFNVEVTSNQPFNILIMSLLIYVWFILTTKLDVTWNIGVIILLAIYFLFESKKINDLNISLKDVNIEQNKKNELIEHFTCIQNYLLIGIFGVTVIGSLFYASEKQVQYGGGFNLLNFWF